jgi:hypothetical protein
MLLLKQLFYVDAFMVAKKNLNLLIYVWIDIINQG